MTSTLYISIRAAIVAGALAALTAMAACSSDPVPSAFLARVGDRTLTEAEVRKAMPAGLAESDSAAFVEAYVNNWVNNALIDRVAANALRNKAEIDRLVEQYRRDLTMWEYRRLAVESDTALAVSEQSKREYYAAHSGEMTLDEPMVRGIYLKLESADPALADVRRLYASPSADDIDRLEKVGLRSAVHYDYFRNQWVPAEQVLTKIPKPLQLSDLRKGAKFDIEVDGFTYLLSVSDVLPAGAVMPYEAAEPRISETLGAMRMAELDALLLRRLRSEALSDGLLELK